MATLQFVKKSNTCWEAKAKVTADFNIHIERIARGSLWVGVSTVEGGAYSDLSFEGLVSKTIDKDFDLQVYPKYICVQSGTEVISGEVNDTKEEAVSTTTHTVDEDEEALIVGTGGL